MRSDTVTKPNEAMKKAMAEAEVDDDVLGHDPTCEKLENAVAGLMGKEAGLFVPSGTMANLIAVLGHCNTRGSEVLLGDECHITIYEQGGISQFGGVHPRTVKTNDDGTLSIDELESKIRPCDDHFPVTKLVCLENTHNKKGGKVLTKEYTDKVGAFCKRHGLKLHMDGARIMNAAVKLEVEPKSLVEPCDTVSVCLSKGLGAPVGSVLVGPKDFIVNARRTRKALGGGMRQNGVLAAAGLVALARYQDLKVDHANADLLLSLLDEIPVITVEKKNPYMTNLVYFTLLKSSPLTAAELVKALREQGVLALAVAADRIRMVIHHQVTEDDVNYVAKIAKTLLSVAV